jgi:DNA uptake protein ComE-like DNA-binding protein
MRRLGSVLLTAGLLAGCGGTSSESSSEALDTQQAPLTATDVDVAPECQGLLTFVNGASFATLDAYLPSDVATNLVNRRTTAPFATLAEVAAVPLVGPARLAQIEGGARAESYIDATCAGIRDELAVSADDEDAMLELVNSVSSTELHDVLPYAWNGATNLLNLRPFTSTQGIANTAGIGTVSFRNLRNAATLSRPLEHLIEEVNATPLPHRQRADMARHFDWHAVAWDPTYLYYSQGMECFGIEPSRLPQEASIRPNLATAAEVRERVEYAVAWGNREGHISSSVVNAGMANLDALIAGRTFKGCHLSWSEWRYWGMTDISFFVDTQSGFSVLVETSWSE